tara:strand:- start:39019 stop:39705 length:687 start_codon:yes stop_codon:yes gene_type:complete
MFSEFEKKIDINFNNKDLLRQAFIHRSYLNENPKESLGHNERLEFLGDAVLELITTEFLYKKFPSSNEGELTSYRAALVNTQSLSQCAQNLDMSDHLLLSRGEAKSVGKARQYILANTFEALIGAIYLDGGYDVAQKFISSELLPQIDEIIENRLWQDAKSLFQEKAQEVRGVTPVYEMISEEGPDHEKIFTVGLYLDGELIARGDGQSKQEAEQCAARGGLEKMGWQ